MYQIKFCCCWHISQIHTFISFVSISLSAQVPCSYELSSVSWAYWYILSTSSCCIFFGIQLHAVMKGVQEWLNILACQPLVHNPNKRRAAMYKFKFIAQFGYFVVGWYLITVAVVIEGMVSIICYSVPSRILAAGSRRPHNLQLMRWSTGLEKSSGIKMSPWEDVVVIVMILLKCHLTECGAVISV